MLELELERDELQKATDLLREVREREKAEASSMIEKTREQGA